MSEKLEELQLALMSLELSNGRYTYGREQCQVLLRHCYHLLSEGGAERQTQSEIVSLSEADPYGFQNACDRVIGCIRCLSQKSLAWSLLNRDTVIKTLTTAKISLAHIFAKYKLDMGHLEMDFVQARRRDSENLKTELRKGLIDDSILIDGLQAGSDKQLNELATALTKHVHKSHKSKPEIMDDESVEVDHFLRTAATTLQQFVGRPPNYEIPHWCVTSFEVTFHADKTRVLGRGAFGRIVEAEWNGELVAMKETYAEPTNIKVIDAIRREAQIWSRLSHPNILPFYGACLEASNPFIISKLCSAGNTLEYLQKHPHVNRVRILRDVCVGMIYLHEQGVIHADLKATNVLIGDKGEALIADFGASQIQDQFSPSFNITRTSSDDVRGTFRWMAPEVLEGKGLNKPVDLYGFALIAWELYTRGAIPFSSIADARLFYTLITKGERPERPVEINDDLWNLVQSCWASDPRERPSFIDVERALSSFGMNTGSRDTYKLSDDSAVARKPIFHNVPHEVESFEDKHVSSSQKKKQSIFGDNEVRPSFFKGFISRRILPFGKSQESVYPHIVDDPHAICIYNDQAILSYARTLPSLSGFLKDTSKLSRVDTLFSYLYNLSLKPEGVFEIINVPNLISASLKRVLSPEQPEGERYLVSGLLANLACTAKARTLLISEPDLISALSLSMTPPKPVSVQENVTRCLYNLSTSDESHPLIIKHEGLLPIFAYCLVPPASLRMVRSVLGCLTNLSHKEPGRSAILSTHEILGALVKTCHLSTEDIIKEQALMCIGNLSVEEKGVMILLDHFDIILGLATCLSNSATPPIKSQALRCLRNLATSTTSHTCILSHSEITGTVSDVFSAREASSQQKYVLGLLHRLTHSEMGRIWLRTESIILTGLQWIMDNGSFEEQAKANDCLKVAQGFV